MQKETNQKAPERKIGYSEGDLSPRLQLSLRDQNASFSLDGHLVHVQSSQEAENSSAGESNQITSALNQEGPMACKGSRWVYIQHVGLGN